MDRLVHTALNSIANLRDQRVVSAQNLANLNVPGFRRDVQNEGRAFYVEGEDQLTARALQMERGPHTFSAAAGLVNQTGEPLDIAIPDAGYFYIQPEGGDPALSRRGDLRMRVDGTLVTGAGDPILNVEQQPIVLPPHRSVMIDEVGTITIEPLEGAPGELLAVATIATTSGTGEDLLKGADGNIRRADGTLPAPDQQARIIQGALEGSNVNPTEELISSIELQRSFEINLRMISTAKELDESGARLLRMPDA